MGARASRVWKRVTGCHATYDMPVTHELWIAIFENRKRWVCPQHADMVAGDNIRFRADWDLTLRVLEVRNYHATQFVRVGLP